jgi:hypothetical protein
MELSKAIKKKPFDSQLKPSDRCDISSKVSFVSQQVSCDGFDRVEMDSEKKWSSRDIEPLRK